MLVPRLKEFTILLCDQIRQLTAPTWKQIGFHFSADRNV